MTSMVLSDVFFAMLEKYASNIGQDNAQAIWQTIVTHYQQPIRHYHTLPHIEAMYQHFIAIKNCLKNPDNILLAIIFHDVIYDPTQSDNEAQSAMFMRHQLDSFLPTALLEQASELIIATQKHQLSDPTNTDMAYFLDMDLAILGQTYDIYQKYAVAIRQEYCHIAEPLFKQGRTAVLQNFLQRERLFFTDYFFEKYENQARQNIQMEIADLAKLKII